jgi:hypothetical protein
LQSLKLLNFVLVQVQKWKFECQGCFCHSLNYNLVMDKK